MAYSSIIPTSDDILNGNGDVIESGDISAILTEFATPCRDEMKLDLQAALGRAASDPLDDIADAHGLRLRKALSYLVLRMFYMKYDDGEGTKNRFRFEFYDKLYNDAKSSFASLNLATGASTGVVTSFSQR